MTTLHVTNGDCAADTLRRIVDDPVTIMADVLHEGPCPPIDGDAWHEVRARFLASDGGTTVDEVKATLAGWDQAIADACMRSATASAERHDIVLWFEHDLFDQLALIRTLDLIVRLKPDPTDITGVSFATPIARLKPDTAVVSATETGTIGGPSEPQVVSGFSRTSPRVSLICIGSFPGIDRFVGLGQLTAEQLATLEGTGVPVIAGHFALARDAWRAFRSPDPAELLDLTRQLDAARVASSEGGPALPFLGDALLRFLAEFPSVANGLSRTEELALRALLDGAATAGALFGATQSSEERPFMGDLPFFDILERLASGRVPLITIDAGTGEAGRRERRVAITDAGRDVLANRADYVRLNGIDLWRGGVHLTGSDNSPWRWDARAETLVS